MIDYRHIDIEKSIQTGYLSIKQDWFMIFERIFFVLLFLPLTASGIIIQFKVQLAPNGITDRFLLFVISPLLILFGLYGSARKIMELKLTTLVLRNSNKNNKEIILAYAQKYSYEILHTQNNMIIASNENEFFFTKPWTKQIVFILTDEKVYFNILTQYPPGNPPVLFGHLILKWNLKYFIKKTQTT